MLYLLYSSEDCLAIVEGRKVTKMCNFVSFPNQTSMCRTFKLTEVILPSGQKVLRGTSVYCYKSLRMGPFGKVSSTMVFSMKDDIMV